MFRLNKEEYQDLRSQIVTSSWGGRRYLPYAFTEHGAVMLSSVLKSKKAVEMGMFVVRAFIKIREILSSNKDLAYKIEELEREQKVQNKHIKALYSIIAKMIEEPIRPKGPMGFEH